MLRCSEFVEHVTAVEEGAASASLRFWFQVHRLECVRCRRYLRQMRAVRGAMSHLDTEGQTSRRTGHA